MMKFWTIDDLKMDEVYAKADGQWKYSWKFDGSGIFEINYSTILTKLIQEAGRWCEDYASDLFIDWSILTKNLKNEDFKGGKFAFGFRRYGVDDLNGILSRLNDGDSKEYRSVWMLDVEVSDDEITMKLGRVNI